VRRSDRGSITATTCVVGSRDVGCANEGEEERRRRRGRSIANASLENIGVYVGSSARSSVLSGGRIVVVRNIPLRGGSHEIQLNT
jgi:hypothetical protein